MPPRGKRPPGNVPQVWKTALPKIRSAIGERNFNSWIEPLEASGNEDEITLSAPNESVSSSVSRHFVPLISSVVTEIAGHPYSIKVSIGERAVELPAADARPTRADTEATFERFVVGESNLDAYNQAVSVAEGTFKGPSPLVLHGWVGLGKTHLAGAIANAIRKDPSRGLVICEPAMDFVDDLLAAMRGDHTPSREGSWERLASAAVLILDDVHFLAGQDATQDALVRTFSLLHDRGTPVVLTSDRPPQEIPDVQQRLRRRFEGGVLAAIAPPERDLRRRILIQKALDRGVSLSETVAEFLAEKVVGGGRTLEGILTRVQAFAATRLGSKKTLTRSLAATALRAFETPRVPATPDFIRSLVAEVLGVPLRAMAGRKKTRQVTQARQLAMYLCRRYSKLPLGEIALRLGRKDHSTVLHACRVVEERRKTDPEYDALVVKVEELVRLRAR